MDNRSAPARPSSADGSQPAAKLPLVLATVSFAVSFAAWGLVGGLASVFSSLYSLSASQTALLVAVPVLLGSLARLPMGMLTDRFGGRNPVGAAKPAGVGAMLALLRRSPVAWLLGAFYFLTFGGFVAFSIYLPTLLRAQFGLAPRSAPERVCRPWPATNRPTERRPRRRGR
jgi:NNP family nitrate/nitrite transporter-like MFS transporter